MFYKDDSVIPERIKSLDLSDELKDSIVMIIGVDSLRSVNARFGFERGNEILGILENCIIECAGDYFVCRLSSKDSYAVFMKTARDVEIAKNIYYRVREKVEAVSRQSNFLYVFTVSAGIYLLDGTISEYSEIQSRVDFALYKAKQNGRNCAYVFDKRDFDRFARSAELQSQLRAAVEAGFDSFEVYYQPIVDVKTYRVSGAEALLRFRSDGQMISPAEFIPALEDSGLIVPVGLFVIRQAMQESKKIRSRFPDFTIHINLSYVQFKRSYILGDVDRLLEETGADPRGIVFEITESGFLIDDDRLQNALKGFRSMGIKIALDDFGTGYSNFIYLKDSKIDIVKLDKEFVNGALNNETEYRLLKKIIDIVHDMNLRICLEGIETMSEMTIFSAEDPDFVQGFVFGRPVPMKEFYEEFLIRKDATVLSIENKEKLQKKARSISAGSDGNDSLKSRALSLKKRLRNSHFYYTITGSILPVLMFLIIIFAVMAGTFVYNVIKTSAEDTADIVLACTEDYVDDFMSQASDLCQMIADTMSSDIGKGISRDYEKMLIFGAESNDSIKGCGLWFEPYAYDKESYYLGPYALKNHGETRVTYNYSNKTYDYLNEYYYSKVKAADRLIITFPYYDEYMDTTILTIAAPIHGPGGRFLGCSTVDVTVDVLKEYVRARNAEYSDEGEFMLLGRYGIFIAGETKDSQFRSNDFRNASKSKKNAIREMITSEEGSVMYSDVDGQYCLYYRTIPSLGWKLVYKNDISNNNHGIFLIVGVIILIAAVTLLLSIILMVRLAERLTKEEEMNIQKRKLYDETQLRAMQSAFDLIAAIDLETDDMLVAYKAYKVGDFDHLNESSFIHHRQDFINHIHEDDVQVYLSVTEAEFINRALEERSYISSEFRMRVEEEYKWMELIISRAKEREGEEHDSRCIYMLRDINDRKLSEELADIEKQLLINQLQNANKVLFEHGISDPLTGVYNRDGLEHYSGEIIDEARLEGRRLLFLLADVNRLKLINDTFGHLSGDKAIKMVGEALTSLDSEHQMCARIGGDEFVYIASLNESADIDRDIIGRFSEALAEKNADSDLDFEVTFSLGYFWGRPLSTSKLDDYIRIADSRMYNMKKSRKY